MKGKIHQRIAKKPLKPKYSILSLQVPFHRVESHLVQDMCLSGYFHSYCCSCSHSDFESKHASRETFPLQNQKLDMTS